VRWSEHGAARNARAHGAQWRWRPHCGLGIRELKALGHHADHGVLGGHSWAEHGIERDRSTDDLRVSAEVPAPCLVAEKDHQGGMSGRVRSGAHTAEEWSRTQQLEARCRYA